MMETVLEIITGIFAFAILAIVTTLCFGSIAIIIDNERRRRSRR